MVKEFANASHLAHGVVVGNPSDCLIDTHAHLMFDEFKNDIDEVIARAKNGGVEKIINVGCDVKTSVSAHEMSLKHENLYATLGLHPYDAIYASEELMIEWEKLISMNKKIVAIGECGLDYFKAKVPKEDQKKGFKMQLKLAQKVGLPVIIHNREANEDCLNILREFDGSDGSSRINAVFHCYGSDVNFARELWKMGYMTSFTGIITYPNALSLREVVRECPINMFMVETDCPYLAPQKFRGQRNEPSYVTEVVEKIAEVKGLTIPEIERISTENVLKFFFKINK